jgi:hypothetical protein
LEVIFIEVLTLQKTRTLYWKYQLVYFGIRADILIGILIINLLWIVFCQPFWCTTFAKDFKQINAVLNATPYILLKSIYIDFREITKARLAISVSFRHCRFMLGIYDLHS